MRTFYVGVVFVLALIVGFGCGEVSPRQVAQTYIDGLKDKDIEKIKASCSIAIQKQIDLNVVNEKVRNIKILGEEMFDSYALVTIDDNGYGCHIRLERINGKWKITSIRLTPEAESKVLLEQQEQRNRNLKKLSEKLKN